MALTWEVCRTRDASGNVSVADNDVDTSENRGWSVNYLAIASGIDDPFDVSEISALRAPGIPLLKQNVYVDPDGTVFPYFSARNKTATRNPSNPYVFDIAVEYVDDSGSDGEEVQADPESYAPSIRYTVKSRQRSSWTDVDDQPYKLPTGSKYKSPLMLDYPCLVAEVTQLENTFSAATLKSRMLRTNTSTWNVMAAETALITNITYEKVKVPVGVAGIITGYQDSFRVKYTIEENDLVVRAGWGTPGTVNFSLAEGAARDVSVNWKQMRPRIDSLCLVKGKIQPAANVSPTLQSVYLQEDARYWHGPNDSDFPDVPPPIDTYRVYENASFNFLRI